MDAWSNPTPLSATRTHAADFLRAVYGWMAFGLALTGLVAFGVAGSPGAVRAIFGNPILFWGIIIAQFGMVLAFSSVARRASFAVVAAMFLGYCALMGVTFSVFLLAYTGESIASTFFITGGAFGAMSAYGVLTKKDLSSWGSFLFMGLIGVVLAGLVNLWWRNDALAFVLSCMGVVVFTGLTAYDTQKILAYSDAGDERLALRGALMLYLDFINLFLSLLRLFGRRR